ncbi:hypothetical protein SAMN05216403_1131 [Nitrosospira multiformis ATCC 25196]|uniref:Uncharacterized protein n=1 Tax=Nitrosospira multiformis (strain ATCC 25196 / NCIMB 11849 / C 71) TaxID=323848 RepID=A0A1H5VLM7_NITMU|nr:hypothetical protein SAMN05216403_1131 [Nitrosospira multiformis ATCC 25196]
MYKETGLNDANIFSTQATAVFAGIFLGRKMINGYLIRSMYASAQYGSRQNGILQSLVARLGSLERNAIIGLNGYLAAVNL